MLTAVQRADMYRLGKIRAVGPQVEIGMLMKILVQITGQSSPIGLLENHQCRLLAIAQVRKTKRCWGIIYNSRQ